MTKKGYLARICLAHSQHSINACCMNCANEMLSVFVFPGDHISIQMLHSYFMMTLLSADTLKDFTRLYPSFLVKSTFLLAVVHGSATWFLPSCPAP